MLEPVARGTFSSPQSAVCCSVLDGACVRAKVIQAEGVKQAVDIYH